MDIGLVYMGARYYLPSVGRFVSADTIIPDPSNPQAYNRFSYAYNNPVRFTDPTGHQVVMPNESSCWQVEFCPTVDQILDFIEWKEENGCAAVIVVGCVDENGMYVPTAEFDEWNAIALQDAAIAGMFVTGMIGADAVYDGAELIGCVATGNWSCAAWSAGGLVVPFATGSALRRVGSNIIEEAGQAFARNCLNSFSEDTVVMTDDGLVPIAELEVDDMVLAYDEETSEIGYYPITVVWIHEDPVIVYLTIEGETLITTPEHPFYTEDGQWIAAGNLQPGNEIRSADWDTGTVQSVHFVARPQTMYNLTVATAHTFFVGDEQWLVHNCDLKLLHNVDNLSQSTLDYWGNQRTEDIIRSLLTNGEQHLQIRPDGTVLQGNHRVKVLMDRGYDVSQLYDLAEIIPKID